MRTDPGDDLRQQMPFASLQHEAQLAVVRTGMMLQDAFERMLKPHGITGTQYNVLRILRGAEPGGLCRNELRDRLLNRMPDVTRLLDRMEEAGLIARTRESEDRRLVRTRVTAEGLRLLDALDEGVTAEQQRPFGELDEGQLRVLLGLLSAVRQKV
jgi:DNA-binding MarR family transcriptional regulator